MNLQWTPSSQIGPGNSTRISGRFDLEFVRHGDHTSICRQFVSYPFHLTRPFALDPLLPHLTTIYQQSSSGGLYRAERLQSHYHVGHRAAAHVTTQAATIVHDCRGQPAMQTVDIATDEDAFLAFTPDPLVLFPGAACVSELRVTLARGAVVLIADSFARHDPKFASRTFDTYVSNVALHDVSGKLLVRDFQKIAGNALAAATSPIGHWSIVSSFLLLGDLQRLPSKAQLHDALTGIDDAVAGTSELPNAAGYGVRCLAADATAARRVTERLFSLSVCAALGKSPVPRRK